MFLACLRQWVLVAVLSSIATLVMAEDAPVYDVDNFPPQFDGQPVASTPSVPASSPVTKSEDSYVPAQTLSQEQRLTRLEQQIKNQDRASLSAKVEATQAEVQSLRGQVEELTHQLQQSQNQLRSMYSDLDKRVSSKAVPDKTVAMNDAVVESVPSNKKTTSAVVKPASSEAQPNVAEEQQIYQSAYDLIKAKKYNEAVSTLQKMLQKYPSGQFAANAHYWLGELYGLLNKNDQSASEFATVVKDYPDSPKVADAQLKLGLIYAGQFKWPDAKAAFKKVVARYPGTPSARLASEQLKQLKQAQAQAGH